MRTRWIWPVLIFLLLGRTGVAKEGSVVLVGTIGNLPIAMEINCSNTRCDGRYFYLSKLHDIACEGLPDGDSLTMEVREWTSKEKSETTVETFALASDPDGSYHGTWTGKSGPRLPVTLHPLDVSKLVNPYRGLSRLDSLQVSNPLDYYRITKLTLKKDSITTCQGHRLQWYGAKQSSVVLFEVLNGYGAMALKKINDTLKSAFFEQVNDELSCTYGSDPYKGDFEESASPVFFSEHVMSASVFSNTFCGGAHPDWGTIYYNFNARTGDQLQLEDVALFAGPDPGRTATHKWFAYRDSVGETLVDILSTLYPKEMGETEDTDTIDDCDYSMPEQWAFAEWFFTSKGIFLSPDIPHVAAPCRDPSFPLIPYQILKKYRNPKVKLILP